MTTVLVACVKCPYQVSDGATLRWYHLMRAFASEGVRVILLCALLPEEREPALRWASEWGIELHEYEVHNWQPYTALSRESYVRWVKSQVQHLIASRRIEGAILDPYLSTLVAAQHWGIPVVVDLVDEKSPHLMKEIREHLFEGDIISFLRKVKWLWLYLRALRAMRGAHIVVAAHDDAHRVRKICGRSQRVAVIPNGVCADSSGDIVALHHPACIFHGVLDYPPNHEAALFLATHFANYLQARNPLARIYLVGANPSETLYANAASNVVITGRVENVFSYLRSADVGVYPIFTRTGIQNKILEAWAAGLPVVTTPQVDRAFRPYVGEKRCYLLARDCAEFTEACFSILSNVNLRKQLVENAQRLVSWRFQWKSAARSFLELLHAGSY